MSGIFVNIVLPVFLVAGLGYLVGRWKKIPVHPISQVLLYLFMPSLAFSSLIQRSIAASEAAQIVAFVLLLASITLLIELAFARIIHAKPDTTSAFMLSTLFPNCGNFGLSISLLAFGDEGLQRAIVFFVVQSILAGTLAVFIASRGQGNTRAALAAVLKMPVAYTSLAAVAVVAFSLPVPEIIVRATSILGSAAVPGMLTMLGLQLVNVKLTEDLGSIAGATVVRLAGSAALGVALAAVLSISGVARDIVILQSAMPSAVATTLIAAEFNARPRFVTGVVFTTTLGSVVTLTLLLSWLTGAAL